MQTFLIFLVFFLFNVLNSQGMELNQTKSGEDANVHIANFSSLTLSIEKKPVNSLSLSPRSDSDEIEFSGGNTQGLNKLSPNEKYMRISNSPNQKSPVLPYTYVSVTTESKVEEKYQNSPIPLLDRDIEFRVIDRDFFARHSQSWPATIFRGMRISVATGCGVLVSMPTTAEVMILVGDWVDALVDTPAASVLAAYIAIKSTVGFANVWDNCFQDCINYLYPVYVTCTTPSEHKISKPEDVKQAAKDEHNLRLACFGKYYVQDQMRGNYTTLMEEKSTGHYATVGFLLASSMAYAFPSLWQMLWSIEESYSSKLGYVTMPLFYFTYALIFYNVAKNNLTSLPTSRAAADTKDVLKASIQKFKNKIRKDRDFCHNIYEALERDRRNFTGFNLDEPENQNCNCCCGIFVGLTGRVEDRGSIDLDSAEQRESLPLVNDSINNIQDLSKSRLFLFSYFFQVHADACDDGDSKWQRYVKREYIEEITNPNTLYRKQQVESIIYGFLGIGWVTLYSLLQYSFESSLTTFGFTPHIAYWPSVIMAITQSASFVKATNKIYHTHGQKLVTRLLAEKATDNDESSCCTNIGGKIRNCLGYVPGVMKSSSNLATGVILSLAELKRGLETYEGYSIPEKVVGAGVPFIMGTLFLHHVFETTTSSIWRKVTTNLPSCCRNLFNFCRQTHELETLNMYADDAMDFIDNCNESIRGKLELKILQQQIAVI